jgi:S-formylglutathione hydrolase FrmB
VLFLGIGSAEGQGTKQFSDALTNAGLHNIYFESPGTAHEWLTWRRRLNDFTPRPSASETAAGTAGFGGTPLLNSSVALNW